MAASLGHVVAQVGSGAEKALAEAQLVDLPNTGAFVLPLAAHGFLVGLLFLEQVARPSEPAPCTNIRQSDQMAESSSSAGKYLQLQSTMTCDTWTPARYHFKEPSHVYSLAQHAACGHSAGLALVALHIRGRAGSLLPGAGMQADGSGVLLGDEDREVVRLAGRVLAAACAMDLHSALQSAQASMHNQQVIGLVEEVSQLLVLLTLVHS